MPNSDTLFANPFPPLILSDEEKIQLREYAESLVQGHLAAYEDYLADSGDDFSDKSKWKHTRQNENVHVYARRKDADPLSSLLGINKKSNIKVGMAEDTEGLIDMQGIGTINGTLDDFMNGVEASTLADFRLKTAYVQDNAKKKCILATIKSPTPEDPYDTFVVKYRTNDFDGLVNYVAKDLDFVYMDLTGFRTLRSGERVGFLLAHSVSFPETSYLEGASWSNIALCYMARQKSDGVLETFSRGLANSPKKILRPVVLNAYGKVIANTASRHVERGIMRKLTWLVHVRSKEERYAETNNRSCTVCDSKLPSNAKFCRLCYHLLCNDCQVKKRMYEITQDNEMSKLDVVFCSPCLYEAVRMDARALRSDELRAKMNTNSASASMSASFSKSISISS